MSTRFKAFASSFGAGFCVALVLFKWAELSIPWLIVDLLALCSYLGWAFVKLADLREPS